MHIAELRAQFPITQRYAYLNHGGIAPISQPVVDAIGEAALVQAEHGSEGYARLAERVASVKQQVAALIGAAPSEIALVRNTVEGLSTVASGILWSEGDNVVANDIEFPANIYPWLNLESRYGVETRLVAAQDGKVLVEDIMAACDERTRVVTVSYVQFSNGYRVDLERLGAFCHERDIYLCVDSIQGVGALKLDVERCHIDFLANGGHKWLLGPIGIGFMYLRQDQQADIWPSEVGHLSVFQNRDKYTEYDLTFRPSAEKFEGGTHNFTSVWGFDAALQLFHKMGPSRVEERVLALTDRLCEALQEHGFRLLSHRSSAEKSGTVSFVSDQIAPEDMLQRLKQAGVIVSLREAAIRVSPHCYNTEDEIDMLVDALTK